MTVVSLETVDRPYVVGSQRLRAGGTQVRRLLVSSPMAEKMAEAVAMAAVGSVLLEGPLAVVLAALVLWRALRTPVPRLGIRPFEGASAYLVDLLASFGVAAVVLGPGATRHSAAWLAIGAVGFAARVTVVLGRWAARRMAPRARVRLMVTGQGADDLVEVLQRQRRFGIDAFCVGDVSVSGRRLDSMVDSVEADAVLFGCDELSPALRHALDDLPIPVFVTAGGTRSFRTGAGASGEFLWTERVIALPPAPMQRPSWVFRTVVERLVALLGLVVTAPLLLALAVGVRLTSPGPVLFRQTRVGLGGREFTIMKFRSMPVDHDASSWNAAYKVEPTPLGRVMRQLNLDELPQLFNVVRGEMSLVGPRPELPEFVDAFTDTVEGYGDRHRMPVGMTGWAQVHGLRGNTSLVDRVAFDNNYIDDWSIGRDLAILVRTVTQFLPARFRSGAPPAEDVVDLRDSTVRRVAGAATGGSPVS